MILLRIADRITQGKAYFGKALSNLLSVKVIMSLIETCKAKYKDHDRRVTGFAAAVQERGEKAERDRYHQRKARSHRAAALPHRRRTADGEGNDCCGRIVFCRGRVGFLLGSCHFLCRRFFQDVGVHPLLCAALRLDSVESGLHFVFVHASSPPNVSFSFARASRSWFRTVDGSLQSIAAISSVW